MEILGISYGEAVLVTLRDLEGDVARLVVPADVLEQEAPAREGRAPLFDHG